MALVTDAPDDLPEANPDVLKDLIDPDELIPERKVRAEIQMSGKTMTMLEDPPGIGDTVTLMVELEVTAEGREKRKATDEYSYYRKTRLVACWVPGTARPERKKTQAELDAEAAAEAAEDQPPLFDEDGQEVDFDDDTPAVDPDGEDLGRPPFSDGAE